MTSIWPDASDFILAGYVGLLLTAVAYDISSFRIPNWLSATLGVLFIVAALSTWGETDWVSHVGAGLAVLAAGLLFHHMGWLGGGDVKLLAVGSLWLGAENLLSYMVAVSVLGGVFTLAMILVRRAAPRAAWLLGRSDISLPRVLQSREKVPYAVAIAGGSLLLLDRLPLMAGPPGA